VFPAAFQLGLTRWPGPIARSPVTRPLCQRPQ
jgi:hypothetical protein